MYDVIPALRREVVDYTEVELKVLQEQMRALHQTAQRVPNEAITLGMLDEVVQWKEHDAGPTLGTVEKSGEHAALIGGGFGLSTVLSTVLPATVAGTVGTLGGGLGALAANALIEKKFKDSPKTRVALKTLVNGGILVAGGLATGLWWPIAGAVGVGLLSGYAYRALARTLSGESQPQTQPQDRTAPQPVRS